MPKWITHDKWARELGISSDVSRFVNLLIDEPQKNKEFLTFCNKNENATIYRRGKPTKSNVGMFDYHDSGRSNKALASNQLHFVSLKGENYVIAWYLHQVLDYIEWWVGDNSTINPVPPIDNILIDKRINKKIGDSQNPLLTTVVSFVKQHSEEILRDLRT